MKLKMEAMTNEQIREVAPCVFTKKPSAHLSASYVYLPTHQVVEDMRKLGWIVCQAVQVKRQSKGELTQRHMVRFYHPDIKIEGKDGDDVFPQILLITSHDGTCGFKLQIGLFRVLCTNGLVVMDVDFGSFSIRHTGYTFEELTEKVHLIVEGLPKLVTKINKFRTTEMTDKQMKKFALDAVTTRFGREYPRLKDTVDQLLAVERDQDKGNNLWTVLNRVQEKLMGGTFKYNNGKKERKARSIKNFTQDMKLNSQLWELAEAYA